MSKIFKIPEELIESSVVQRDGRLRITLGRGFKSVAVEQLEAAPARLVRAARDESRFDEQGNEWRVLFWRIEAGSNQASPVYGGIIPPIDPRAIFANSEFVVGKK